MNVAIQFSQLNISGRVGCKMCLWNSKPCPDSSCLATVVFNVPVSVDMSDLYAFPGWNLDLGRCVINFHMQSSLTPTSL